jgi:hypothetical protein
MARPKLNTVVLDFVGDSVAAPIAIVDIPKALSRANRKFYRSGYVYSVDFIEYIGGGNESVTIAKIPENYNALAAYKLGFHVWREQRAVAIGESGMEPGKWSDFKPFYDINHFDGTFPELNVQGMGAGMALAALDATGAEWNRAEVEINDLAAATTSTINIGMLGNNDLAAAPGAYGGLIEAWGNTRVQVLNPDPLLPTIASASWIAATGEASREMTADVIDLIEAENDSPPYASQPDVLLPPTYVGNGESAPLGMMVDFGVTGSTGRPLNLDGGLIPLGLLAIKVEDVSSGVYHLRVHCTRGEYKGVAALPMGDFS